MATPIPNSSMGVLVETTKSQEKENIPQVPLQEQQFLDQSTLSKNTGSSKVKMKKKKKVVLALLFIELGDTLEI